MDVPKRAREEGSNMLPFDFPRPLHRDGVWVPAAAFSRGTDEGLIKKYVAPAYVVHFTDKEVKRWNDELDALYRTHSAYAFEITDHALGVLMSKGLNSHFTEAQRSNYIANVVDDAAFQGVTPFTTGVLPWRPAYSLAVNPSIQGVVPLPVPWDADDIGPLAGRDWKWFTPHSSRHIAPMHDVYDRLHPRVDFTKPNVDQTNWFAHYPKNRVPANAEFADNWVVNRRSRSIDYVNDEGETKTLPLTWDHLFN